MANLRLTRIQVISNTIIRAQFTAPLDPLLSTDNIDVEPIISTLPKPTVLGVEIRNNIIDITVQPLTPFASYDVTFQNGTLRFKSLNGSQFLLEDGKTNVVLVLGLAQPHETITDVLKHYLKED